MKLAFIDTSVLLRFLFKEKGAYPLLSKLDRIYASELLQVETLRGIDRLRIEHRWQAEEVALRRGLFTEICQTISFVPLQKMILQRASEPFATVVGTMDAIHIASALLVEREIGAPLFFLTHDKRQGVASKAAGLKTEIC
ncbi:MAG: PIN domain-containing protein [Deltaproteobacteria bacterium]|nr:PIN domain-containing protein [Deltaproteobacteria bacterium]